MASGIEADDHAGEHYDAVLAAAATDAVTPHVVLGDHLRGRSFGKHPRRAAAGRR